MSNILGATVLFEGSVKFCRETPMTRGLLALGAAVVLTAATFVVTEADARSGGRGGGGGGFRGGGFGGGGFRGGGFGGGFRGGVAGFRGGGVAFRGGGVAFRGGVVGFRGGGVRFAHRPFVRRGFVGVGGYYPYYGGYGYGYGYSCLRTVWTAYGPATVNVCLDDFGY
jgi:hypothetical protein